ncbi:MAG TPA: insulinase family protein [Thermoplasmata archaeon]|nr:insulinase family protein [Thermoplasmata archaeon]
MKIKKIATILVICLLIAAIPYVYCDGATEDQILKETLPNGLRILIKEKSDTNHVILLAMVGTGSANENEENNGISHFIEHMITVRGSEELGEYGIFKEVERVGGQANAFTSFEMTSYFTILPKENFDLGLTLLKKALFNPPFKAEDVEEERGIILEELEFYREDIPAGELQTMLLENAFPNHPYGRHIVGTRETVNAINREMMIDYYNTYYAPNNVVFVVVGNVDAEKVLSKVRESFKDWEQKDIPERELAMIKIEGEKEVTKTREGIEEAYLGIAYIVPGCDQPDHFPLELLSLILGSGRSSRLYQALVAEGLASSVGAGLVGTKGQQLLTIIVTCDQEDIPEVEKIILKEINTLKKGITDGELKKAKNMYKVSSIMTTQNLMYDATYIAMFELLYGMEPKEYLAKLNILTTEDIQKAAEENFKKEYVVVHLIPEADE